MFEITIDDNEAKNLLPHFSAINTNPSTSRDCQITRTVRFEMSSYFWENNEDIAFNHSSIFVRDIIYDSTDAF